METDPTRMCALLVGLRDVRVVGVGEWLRFLRVVISTCVARLTCVCGSVVHGHGVREVELVALAVFGRAVRLVWRKQRWPCPACGFTSTEQQPEIASARCALTTRAAKWATVQVGRHSRSVSGNGGARKSRPAQRRRPGCVQRRGVSWPGS